MGNVNGPIKISQATPAPQPTPARKTTNKPVSPPKDRFVPPGAGEKDVIQQLNELGRIISSTHGRESLTEIAKKRWSSSPEFALAFLRAAIKLSHGPYFEDWKECEKFRIGLRDKIQLAILNLIQKNTPPPEKTDGLHILIAVAGQIWMEDTWQPFSEGTKEGLEFIWRLARERPLYADYFCSNLTLNGLHYRRCSDGLAKKRRPTK